MASQRRRFQYIDSFFDARATPFVVPAGAELAAIKLDSAPHGVYSLVTSCAISGASFLSDFTNFELRKNDQKKYPLSIFTLGPQQGFTLVLNSNDKLSINAAIAGTAAANYIATMSLTLIHEMSANPEEEPDTMAVLASQQERIGNALEKLCAYFEGLKAK